MAGKLAAKGAGAAERLAGIKRRLSEREKEHAAALGAWETASFNERTTGIQEAERQRDEAAAAERGEAQQRAEAAREIGTNVLLRHILVM